MKPAFLALLALTATTALAAEAKRVELKLELPKPVFQGTRFPVKVPNLEATNAPPAKIMVPEGTTNVARGKKVTSSDPAPVVGELEMVTDGDKEGSDGHHVELGPGVQWIQIDLGAPYIIHAVAIWHFHSRPRAYHDVIVQVCNDPDFVTDVKTVYNNDHDNSAGLGIGSDKAYIETHEGRLIDTKTVSGRYIRCYSKGNTEDEMNHYIEVEVYGIPETKK